MRPDPLDAFLEKVFCPGAPFQGKWRCDFKWRNFAFSSRFGGKKNLFALGVTAKNFNFPFTLSIRQRGANFLEECVKNFEEIFSLEHLLQSHLLCRKCKQHKREVVQFELNLGANLIKLQKQLLDGTFKISKYRSFKVHEPKERLIESLPYPHRVVQRCLCEFALRPEMDKTFIFDNCACRKDKGLLFALNRLKIQMKKQAKKQKYGYALALDIHKFYPSIDHEIAKQKLLKFGFDERTWSLACLFVEGPNKDLGRGLAIGNQVSQWIGLLMLDGLDKYVKNVLKVPFYVRYMDDFVLFGQSRSQLLRVREQIALFLSGVKLELKEKSDICRLSCGVAFCGFLTISNNGRVYRKILHTSTKRMKFNLSQLRFLRKNRFVSQNFYDCRIQSYKAYAEISDVHSTLPLSLFSRAI